MTLPRIDPSRSSQMQASFKYICETFGVEYNKENSDQMLVFMEALLLYDQRSQQYGQLWKDSGAVEEFFNAYRKARRVYTTWSRDRVKWEGRHIDGIEFSSLDDAFDAINYLVFGIRNARAGRFDDKPLPNHRKTFTPPEE